MEVASIVGEKRAPGSRNANNRLRQRGMLPAVIYGHGEAPEHVAVSMHDTVAALENAAHVIELKIDGKGEKYLIKEVQYDHLQKTPVHVDLMRVDLTERVTVTVPLDFRGTAAGAAAGGVLTHVIADLEVECLVTAIPESIRVKVDHMQLGDTLFVKNLELPEGVTAKHEPDDIVAVCRQPRGGLEEGVVAPAEGESSAEPEVIGKGKADEDAAE